MNINVILILNHFSSLLVVYEGFEEITSSPMDTCGCCVEDDESHNTGSYCYDADASNDSTDLNFSSSREDHNDDSHPHLLSNSDQDHDKAVLDVTKESHKRGYGEAAARGAKAPFIPISEETMYLESAESAESSTLTTSSPLSGDSWMNYSSHSSNEEYGSSSRLRSSSEDEDSVKKNKRICDGRFPFSENSDVDMLKPQPISKRTRAKDAIQNGKSEIKRRQKLPATKIQSPTENNVEVRMIDFAHTTFSRKKGVGEQTSGTIHHGPDNGFLTGIDSLQRLLSDILAEK